MGIKDTEQDRTMMDGPERGNHTGEGGRDERNGGRHRENGNICWWRQKREGEETKQSKLRTVEGKDRTPCLAMS